MSVLPEFSPKNRISAYELRHDNPEDSALIMAALVLQKQSIEDEITVSVEMIRAVSDVLRQKVAESTGVELKDEDIVFKDLPYLAEDLRVEVAELRVSLVKFYQELMAWQEKATLCEETLALLESHPCQQLELIKSFAKLGLALPPRHEDL